MARSPTALADPAVLQWLRTTAGYSIEDAAKRVQTKPENLNAWESGEQKPSMPQLRNLARVFKRPISDFFLSRPMDEPAIPHDFRRLPTEGSFGYSPALRHELRQAHRRRAVALDLLADLEQPAPSFAPRGTATIRDNAEELGAHVRKLLGVSNAEQAKWRDPRIGYNAWRSRIEAAGVLIFQITTVEKAQMLGFSLAFEQLPVIGINRKLKPNGRTFTMLHEFTHLLLGESGLCDIEEGFTRPPTEQAVEVFCNHVAGAALVPMDTLKSFAIVARSSTETIWADDALDALARSFSVSSQVILRRLLIGGCTSHAFYAAKRQELLARYAAMEEAEREQPNEMRRNMAREAASNLGSFARLVVESYQSDAINLTDASKFLGVKAEKVVSVGELLR